MLKAQGVRVADVFVIGPLMAWAGYKLLPRYPVRGSALGLMGIGTIFYNGNNWLEIERAAATQRPVYTLRQWAA